MMTELTYVNIFFTFWFIIDRTISYAELLGPPTPLSPLILKKA